MELLGAFSVAMNFITVSESDLGAGIDQQSAENKIPAGFSEDLLNADTTAGGYIAKRPGYQGVAGYLPLRVQRADWKSDVVAGHTLCLTLDADVDLSTISSSPLVVYGRLSAIPSPAVLPFPVYSLANPNDGKYFDGFTVDNKTVLLTASSSINIAPDVHGQSGLFLVKTFLPTVLPTPPGNQVCNISNYSIDTATNILTLNYGVPSDTPIFISYRSLAPVPGSVYVHSATSPSAGPVSISISAAAHGLSNFNIITDFYSLTAGVYTSIEPDTVHITSAGTLTATFQGLAIPSIVAVLRSVPFSQRKTISESFATSGSTEILELAGNFIDAQIYVKSTSVSDWEQVLLNDIIVDSALKKATLSWMSSSPFNEVVVYYEPVTILSNKLCVTIPNPVVNGTDLAPQLTIWGLKHSEIRSDAISGERSGWVTHIDSYRAAGNNRIIAGHSGNLFAEYGAGEISSEYLLPTLYPDIRARASALTVIAPAFFGLSGPTPGRSSGWYRFTGGEEGLSNCTSAIWITGNTVEYVLSCPGLIISSAPNNVPNLVGQQLRVSQSGHSRNSGTFTISSAVTAGATITIRVTNPERADADDDEIGSGMLAGVFTDVLTLSGSSPFVFGDRLLSDTFGDEELLTVVSSAGSVVNIAGLVSPITINAGQRLVGQRTSSLIPLRDVLENKSVLGLVRGDMLSITGISRKVRVVYINHRPDSAVTIAGNLLSNIAGGTAHLSVGQRILLRAAGAWTGEWTIISIPSSTSLTIETALTGTPGGSPVIQGSIIEIDESGLQLSDNVNSEVSLSVGSRWIPLEAPDDEQGLTKKTHGKYLSAAPGGEQPILKSTMVSDNMYLTNGQDSVLRWDGGGLARAGLPRWQPGISLTADTSALNKIVINAPSLTATDSFIDGSRFGVALGAQAIFPIGSRVRWTGDSATYTVTGFSAGSTSGFIQVTPAPSLASPIDHTLTQLSSYKYYFRLSALDGNDNLISSAIMGVDDSTVLLDTDAAININMIGFPAWDIYDFDKIELQIYRTKLAGVAPYYLVTTLPIPFNSYQDYIRYTDNTSDPDLGGLDPISTALAGAELGTQWSGPLRSKYITSAGNRLVLGNVVSDPVLDIKILKAENAGPITEFNLHGNGFLFKKDSNDIGTASNQTDRQRFEFVSSGEFPISSISNVSPGFRIYSTTLPTVGAWVYLFKNVTTPGRNAALDGWRQVNALGVGYFTVLQTPNSVLPPGVLPNRWVGASVPADIPVWTGIDNNTDTVSGNSLFISFRAITRLSMAINAHQRTLSSPWMMAEAGNLIGNSRIIISQPKVIPTILEVTIPNAMAAALQVFVNDIKRTSGNLEASAIEYEYPSRILISYPNFPEIFSNPTAAVDSESVSVIDVNSADGQEITGIVPFFGESAFGAAQKSGVLVAFKTNSIYLVDIAAKAAGINAVQRIESQGLGCTAPHSIASTRDGIMFANDSGLYRLGRNLSIEYVGQRVERLWRGRVVANNNTPLMELVFGTHYGVGSQYKLSFPLDGATAPGDLLVYSHVREYRGGLGAWTRYSAHPAIGWANLFSDAFFATTDGQVMSIRRTGEDSDYRDDDQPIEMSVLLRALDFGDSSIRKTVRFLIVKFRVISDTSATSVKTARDLAISFEEADPFTIIDNTLNQSGLNDPSPTKVQAIRFSPQESGCVLFQALITNAEIDRPIEIVEVSYRVAGMSDKGITEAAETP